MSIRHAIARVTAGEHLTDAEMAAAMEEILGGGAETSTVANLLRALCAKRETVGELVSAARVLRAHAVPVTGVPPHAIDTCGTGGDGRGTLNVSTAAGLVAAACGVPVAKHGNRAISGRVGGADVLEALGVRLELPPARLVECLRATNFAFLFAPSLHPAIRHAGPARRQLDGRSMFNLLGPLANPAGVRRQVVGVFAADWVVPMAEALLALGAERAWVLHGAGGCDELVLEGENDVAEVADGRVRTFRVGAAAAGLAPANIDALRVESVADAAACLRRLLAGEPGPARDVVCLNAAAALVVAERAPDLRVGVALAARALDSGAAAAVLDRVVRFTTNAGAER